jgi:hypothetical protein
MTTATEAWVTGSLVGILARPDVAELLPDTRYSGVIDEDGIVMPVIELIHEVTGKVLIRIVVNEVADDD